MADNTVRIQIQYRENCHLVSTENTGGTGSWLGTGQERMVVEEGKGVVGW